MFAERKCEWQKECSLLRKAKRNKQKMSVERGEKKKGQICCLIHKTS